MENFKEIQQFSSENNKIIDSSENSKEFLEKIFDERQMEFLGLESEVEKISLDDNGKIVLPKIDKELQRNDIEIWQKREGILDVKEFEEMLIVVYNGNEKIPDGCPDLRKRNHAGRIRSGEYHPANKICFIDLSNSWDFLNDLYNPSWVEEYVRHELRHGLVENEDEKYGIKNNKKSRRNLDWDYIEKNNPEEAQELAYLDELHSQYFDALEGAIEGKDCFRKIESRFYSVAGEGSHLEIASQSSEGKEAAKDLFYHLQGILLLKRMIESVEVSFKTEIENLARGAGVVLATERSVTAAKEKIKLIWDKIISDSIIEDNFDNYIKKYKPNYSGNTPEITKELKDALGI